VAVVRVQTANARLNNAVAGNLIATFGAGPTAGNTLIAHAAYRDGASIPVMVNAGWTLLEDKDPGAGAFVEEVLWTKIATGGGADTTVQVSSTLIGSRILQIVEYSGLSNPSIDVHTGACGVASQYTGLTDAPAETDELWVAGFAVNSTAGVTAGPFHGSSAVDAVTTVDNLMSGRLYEKIPGAAGSGIWTPADEGLGFYRAGVIATFKQGGSAALPNLGTGSVAAIIPGGATGATGAAASVAIGPYGNPAGALIVVFIRTFGGLTTVTPPGGRGWLSHPSNPLNPTSDLFYAFYVENAAANFASSTFTFSGAVDFAYTTATYAGMPNAAGLLDQSASHVHFGADDAVGSGQSPGGMNIWSGFTPLTTFPLGLWVAGLSDRRTVAGDFNAPTNGFGARFEVNGIGKVRQYDRTVAAPGRAYLRVNATDNGVGSAQGSSAGLIFAFRAGLPLFGRTGGLDRTYQRAGYAGYAL
jgi:hypothetical protein